MVSPLWHQWASQKINEEERSTFAIIGHYLQNCVLSHTRSQRFSFFKKKKRQNKKSCEENYEVIIIMWWNQNYKCWVRKLWMTVAMSRTAGFWSPKQTPAYGEKDWSDVYIRTPEDNNSSRQTSGRPTAPQRDGQCSRIHSQSANDKSPSANLSVNLLNLFC